MNKKEDWIDYIIQKVYKYYNNRKVVLWGKYGASDIIKDKLKEKYNIETSFYVDSDASKIDNKKVYMPECLYGKAKEFYVVVPLAFYQSLKEQLIRGGYIKDIDYFYFCDCIVKQTSDYYEDEHGNKIIGSYQGLKFAFSGFGSIIKIGDNVKFQNDTFYVHSNSQINIGNNARFQDNEIWIQRDSQINIGNNAKFQENKIWIQRDSQINIGSNTSFQENEIHAYAAQVIFKNKVCLSESNIIIGKKAILEIRRNVSIFNLEMNIGRMSNVFVNESTTITGKAIWYISKKSKLEIGRRARFSEGQIFLSDASCFKIGNDFSVNPRYYFVVDKHTSATFGRDCMFSYDVYMRCNDGHSIFDINTGENISSIYKIAKSRQVVIGNHVWVGMRCTILYNTRIGDGSIIGASSLVKGRIPNNCIAVGTPARVVRRDIAWAREYGVKDITEIDKEYIHITQ